MKKYVCIELLLFLFYNLLGVIYFTSCSTTKSLPKDEQLYVGMKPTIYTPKVSSSYSRSVKEELDIVLATKPNSSLFNSPFFKSPFPIGLWLWNEFSTDTTKFARWITRTFATSPITMKNANPDLHVSVGKNLLAKRGYLNAKITYKTIPQHNKRKIKLQYNVNLGKLWTIDTLKYNDFIYKQDSLIKADSFQCKLKPNAPFNIASLEAERQRITHLLKNNGYYFYTHNSTIYIADTSTIKGKINLHLKMNNDSLNKDAIKQWRIGKITINLRHNYFELLHKNIKFDGLNIYYMGKNIPLRPKVIRTNILFREGEKYSLDKHKETLDRFNSIGLFSSTNITFTPSNLSDSCTTLDANFDLMFDKPYDFYMEAYGRGKTSGKYGPELILGATKRNAFRGAEILNIRLHGSYEWATKRSDESHNSKRMNDYGYGAEVSLQLPRLLIPFHNSQNTKYIEQPKTTISTAVNIIKRSSFFKRHIVSAEMVYSWTKAGNSSFVFKPLSLSYEYMHRVTNRFKDLLSTLPYLQLSMHDQFIPKSIFQYTYHSPNNFINPIRWTTSVSEASNLLSLIYLAAGKSFNEKQKTLFKNPFAQFLKLETDFTKIWQLTPKNTFVAHFNAGMVWAYGNSKFSPYSEQFFIGGANSLRAFNAREIGPGTYVAADGKKSYVEQTGEIRLQANLEYRPHIIGNIYGALFLDAGNVWTLHEDVNRPGSQFLFDRFFKQIALGTGIGIRYDISFFMIRIDWGIGLHIPYSNGFYNIKKFSDAQTVHFAIGLPF